MGRREWGGLSKIFFKEERKYSWTQTTVVIAGGQEGWRKVEEGEESGGFRLNQLYRILAKTEQY